MLRAILLLLSIAVLQATENQSCLKCHGMANLSEQTGPGRKQHSYHVALSGFEHSNHHSLRCSDCHVQGYSQYPHAEAKTIPDCLGCHQDNSEFLDGSEERTLLLRDMKKMKTEFEQSVHHSALKDSFTCVHCHNPHRFVDQRGKNLSFEERIEWSNAVCLNCHNSEKQINELKTKEYVYRNPEEIHAWLPSAKMHWKKVRCVDCHADFSGMEHNKEERFSHKINPKEKAVRNCNQCHSKESILTTRIYQMNMRKALEEEGLIKAFLWNNSYVIGATRNRWLDFFTLMLLVSGVGGIAIHAYARYYVYRKNRKEKNNGE